jgi:6-phosphogluconolactonase (cycloisomerase 2 family)
VSLLLVSESQMSVSCRYEVTAGSGPSSLALAPGDRSVYVAHSLNGSVSVFDYDPMVGRISDCKQTVQVSHNGEMAVLAMHPSGKTLYSSHGKSIQAWKIAASGSLETLGEVTEVPAIKLHATPDGRNLLALTGDAVLSIKLNSSTHALEIPAKVALVSRPLSIATL